MTETEWKVFWRNQTSFLADLLSSQSERLKTAEAEIEELKERLLKVSRA